eukprot:scaffold111447_cov54-Phaeocystis_antarctica.AAC.1
MSRCCARRCRSTCMRRLDSALPSSTAWPASHSARCRQRSAALAFSASSCSPHAPPSPRPS